MVVVNYYNIIHHGLRICDFRFVAKEDRHTIQGAARAKEEPECYDSHGLNKAREIHTYNHILSFEYEYSQLIFIYIFIPLVGRKLYERLGHSYSLN